jgi:hypothetical protein
MVWSEEMVQSVWEKGRISHKNDRNRWRRDELGAWIGRQDYRNRESEYGWEIDSISPAGPPQLSNLRPLQWQNKKNGIDGRLTFRMAASGKHNAVAGV